MSKVHGSRFAQIPEWVLDAPISDRAVRAYCVLARYANSDNKAHPGRRKMADRMQCSTDSLDRALKELVAMGALEIRPRFRENGDRSTNDYHLLDRPHPSGGVPAPQRPPPSAPQRPASRERAEGREREPENDNQKEQLPVAPPPAAASKAKKPASEDADQLARAEWERRTEKPVCGFMALRSRIQEALDAGHSRQAIARVLPTMPAFSRNAFDFALRGVTRSPKGNLVPSDQVLADNPDYWEEP